MEGTTEVSLPSVLESVWSALEEGAQKGRSPYHIPCLATAGHNGPRARHVVLRAANRETNSLVFHTDLRSNKMVELEQQAKAALTFYGPAEKVQIRAEGVAKVHHRNEFSRERWGASRAESKLCYLVEQAPSSALSEKSSGIPEEFQEREPTEEELEVGYLNFVAVEIAVDYLDWLQLSPQGHSRACFRWKRERWEGTWCQP